MKKQKKLIIEIAKGVILLAILLGLYNLIKYDINQSFAELATDQVKANSSYYEAKAIQTLLEGLLSFFTVIVGVLLFDFYFSKIHDLINEKKTE